MTTIMIALILALFPTSAEVDTFPLGTSLDMVSQAATDIRHLATFSTGWADEADQDTFTMEGPDGRLHYDCTIEVDEPASHMACPDGFHEDS